MSKKTGSKGLDFEERLRSYFEKIGFFAIRGVPYSFDGEDVSDIDVWLYERPNAISRRRTIVDAKNKQRPKAIERILWLKGFQEGLGVEGALVATTDRRESVKKFAATLGISILDGEAVDRLLNAERLDNEPRLTTEEFSALLTNADREQGAKEYINRFEDCKRSLSVNLGFQSANLALETGRFFYEHAMSAKDQKKEAATRAFLAIASFAAVSLDFSTKDMSFRAFEERESLIKLGLRYGEGGLNSTLATLNLALRLARQFATNGNAVSRQIQMRFEEMASQLPVEVVSEYAARVAITDSLYKAARELNISAYQNDLPSFGTLSIESKSFLGVLVDYYGVGRRTLDTLLPVNSTLTDRTNDQVPLPLQDIIEKDTDE